MSNMQRAPRHRYADPSPEAKFGYGLMAVFFIGFLGWAAFAPLDAAVVGEATVKVSGNRQVVQHRDGGAVTRISVTEGARVAAGDVLLDFATHELMAQERATAGLVLELEASRERLHAELAGRSTLTRPQSWAALSKQDEELAEAILDRQTRELQSRFGAASGKASVLRQRGAQLAARAEGSRDSIATLDRQAALIQEELAAIRKLAQEGYAPMSRVRALERTQAEIDGRRIEALSSMRQAREGERETGLQAATMRQERRESAAAELREVEERLIEVMPKLVAIRGQMERAQVRAPTDGVVVGLSVHNVGAVVAPGEHILDVVPDKADLVVEARIAPADADDLKTGAAAQVRFVALERRRFAQADGVVQRVSADSFRDERSGRDYFVAEITVPPDEMQRLAKRRGEAKVPLQPGLPAEVVVPVRKRTALQYLLEPLDQSLWRSFREH
jgi:HlyD family secretion protein